MPYGPEYISPQETKPGPAAPGLAAADVVPAGLTGRETEPQARKDTAAQESLLDRVVRQLAGQGEAARRIWLAPLSLPPALNVLLPPLFITPRGCTTDDERWHSRLQAVAGIVDRPFEQRRDPLWADLSGAAGHVGVDGGPQSGKSTMLRTLICSLALLHTPEEVAVLLPRLRRRYGRGAGRAAACGRGGHPAAGRPGPPHGRGGPGRGGPAGARPQRGIGESPPTAACGPAGKSPATASVTSSWW